MCNISLAKHALNNKEIITIKYHDYRILIQMKNIITSILYNILYYVPIYKILCK